MTSKPPADWGDLFYPQGVPEAGVSALAEVRNHFAGLATTLQGLLPEGRYKAMVKTELEIAASLATKAFTHGHL